MKVSCLAIDVVNADKPTAALAFMAGVCEKANVEYACTSVNSVFLTHGKHVYQDVYNFVKSGESNLSDAMRSVIIEIADTVLEFSPDIIAVSVFSFMQFEICKAVLRELRKRNSNVCIIGGGVGLQSMSEKNITFGRTLLDLDLFNFYVLGEGDEVLLKFINGDRLNDGVNSKNSFNETWVPQIDNLDEMYIIPSYKQIDFTPYHNLEFKEKGVINLSTSRGCVRRCSFCDIAGTWPKFRYRSGSNVAQEVVQHFLDVGISSFNIVDSLINGSLKSFNEFNLEMIKLKETYPGLTNFSYNGMFIIRNKKQHTEEFFKNMSDAGCDSLLIGIETGSDRLREVLNKKFTNEDLDWHMQMCQKFKIRNILLFFVGHPAESESDYNDTLLMLHRYQKYLLDNTIVGINFHGLFSLLPNTPDWDRQLELEVAPEMISKSYYLNWKTTNPNGLSVKTRILRDLLFRKTAIELRYGVAYSDRYLDYLRTLIPNIDAN